MMGWCGAFSQVKRFMPFLEGNRQCIGMSLAKLNYTTAVAMLLSHFTFRLADDVSAHSLPVPHVPPCASHIGRICQAHLPL